MPTRRWFLQHACWMSVASCGLARSLRAQETATAHDIVRDALERAELSLMFGGDTPAECREWQTRFRAKLDELLGPHDPPTEWSAEIRSQATFDDHARIELQLTADGVPTLPVYLLIHIGYPSRKGSIHWMFDVVTGHLQKQNPKRAGHSALSHNNSLRLIPRPGAKLMRRIGSRA